MSEFEWYLIVCTWCYVFVIDQVYEWLLDKIGGGHVFLSILSAVIVFFIFPIVFALAGIASIILIPFHRDYRVGIFGGK